LKRRSRSYYRITALQSGRNELAETQDGLKFLVETDTPPHPKDLDKNMELLRLLGMTDNECRIYLSLLEKPKGESIDNILTRSGLAPQEAEAAVKSLDDKGCISLNSNRIEANPPRDFLANMLHEKTRSLDLELRSVQEAIRHLELSLDPYYWEKRTGLRPEEMISSIRDLPAMENQTIEMIASARNYFYIFAERFDWYDNIRKEMTEALNRGVKAKILMLVKDNFTTKRARELQKLGVEVRHCAEEWYPVRGTLVDDQSLVFVIWATRKSGVERPVYYRPNYTENAGLIRIFKDAFQKRWEEAKAI
jgi:sugar-specific transcriptional regulator TrmB